ncbi:sulfotransferase family protein [Olleya namhaensis]|uniref:Sulfotransferase family protein n=1 Tax=Olleya namhaensis TaxID=1144750 RepID=A0A1I3JPK4_9FLAO|nr:sulfotransferase [Olleya namhaensis]SFI62199.1 Sulfotransferase family protein [Olleya namhaensis]
METVKQINKKPNFLVVGVPKSGTSSLYGYLKEHPEIYLPEQKELHFYTYNKLKENTEGPGDKLALKTVIKSKEEYELLYKNRKSEIASGDISPSYLYFADSAIPLIKSYLGEDVKIIITLRDPIGRAFSNFLHQKRLLLETLPFTEALQSETKRKEQGFGDFYRYKEHSLYFENCMKYINAFGNDNVKIVLFEDIIKNAESEVKSICNFLNVDANFIPKNLNTVFNKGGVYKENKLTAFLLKPSGLKQMVLKLIGSKLANKYKAYKESVLQKNTEAKPEIEAQTLVDLKAYFKQDIEQIKSLNVDITKWKYFN